MNSMKAFFAAVLVATLLFAGCASTTPPAGKATSQKEGNPPKTVADAATPATVYCSQKGYMSALKGEGAKTAYCFFPNGRYCEEWAFFRGECTDADSFKMVEGPGLETNPKSITYKFYSDGRLVLTTTDLRDYPFKSLSLTSWLTKSDFAAFVKKINEEGFESLNQSYSSCRGRPCPTDVPSITLILYRQGNEKQVSVYYPSDRPESTDRIISGFKNLFESNPFVEVNVSGCALVQDKKTKRIDCFGCTSGITNPMCKDDPPAESVPLKQGDVNGTCAVDSQGACAYEPPQQMSKEFCQMGGGSWEECGSACRGAVSDAPCVAMCAQYCQCGGIAGFSCPTGYFCGDYLPKGAADAMGICKPNE